MINEGFKKYTLGLLIIALMFSSCCQKIYNAPSRREINKAMRYSSWEHSSYRKTIISINPQHK